MTEGRRITFVLGYAERTVVASDRVRTRRRTSQVVAQSVKSFLDQRTGQPRARNAGPDRLPRAVAELRARAEQTWLDGYHRGVTWAVRLPLSDLGSMLPSSPIWRAAESDEHSPVLELTSPVTEAARDLGLVVKGGLLTGVDEEDYDLMLEGRTDFVDPDFAWGFRSGIRSVGEAVFDGSSFVAVKDRSSFYLDADTVHLFDDVREELQIPGAELIRRALGETVPNREAPAFSLEIADEVRQRRAKSQHAEGRGREAGSQAAIGLSPTALRWCRAIGSTLVSVIAQDPSLGSQSDGGAHLKAEFWDRARKEGYADSMSESLQRDLMRSSPEPTAEGETELATATVVWSYAVGFVDGVLQIAAQVLGPER